MRKVSATASTTAQTMTSSLFTASSVESCSCDHGTEGTARLGRFCGTEGWECDRTPRPENLASNAPRLRRRGRYDLLLGLACAGRPAARACSHQSLRRHCHEPSRPHPPTGALAAGRLIPWCSLLLI